MEITLVGATEMFAGGFARWAVAAALDLTVVGPSRPQAEMFVKQIGGGRAAGRTDHLRTELVFAAVPYVCFVDAWQSYGAELDGRVVVDLALPVGFAGERVRADSGSAVEGLARARPRARVVKAYHPSFARPQPRARGEARAQDRVLLAGDDASAKTMVTTVFAQGRLRADDFGPLRRARELDALGFAAEIHFEHLIGDHS